MFNHGAAPELTFVPSQASARFPLAPVPRTQQDGGEMATTSPIDDFIRHTLTGLEDNMFVRLILSGGTEARGRVGAHYRPLIRLRGQGCDVVFPR